MADFKALHTKWKNAKKDAKLGWDVLLRLTTDLSSAHKEVTYTVVKFPAFKLDLGPSLDNIQNKKDVAKSKEKADRAVKQYEIDINGLKKSCGDVKVSDKAVDLAKTKKAVELWLKTLGDVLAEIKKALTTVK